MVLVLAFGSSEYLLRQSVVDFGLTRHGFAPLAASLNCTRMSVRAQCRESTLHGLDGAKRAAPLPAQKPAI